MILLKSCLFVKWEERYVTNITSEGRDEWKFFTCPWIKVSAERTLATAREMLTLLADSDTINSPQQASLELNKSPQRWPQGRSSRDERTWWAHLSLDHCTWGGKANWNGKVQKPLMLPWRNVQLLWNEQRRSWCRARCLNYITIQFEELHLDNLEETDFRRH